MSPVTVFLVDDQWAVNQGLLHAAFANAPCVTFRLNQDAALAGDEHGTVVVHLVRGQTVRQQTVFNDAPATVEALRAVEQEHPVSLVLLDMRFDSGPLDSRSRPAGMSGDECFGRSLLSAIRVAFPDLPMAFLTTYGQADIGDETLPYLSKEDISDHSLAVCLLRHGRLSTDQRRTLMHLESEVVVAQSTSDAFFTAFELAPMPLPVLITGETGTGKEVVARYLHRVSRRSEGPFVAVNVNSVPRDLFEAMFFGHMRGAFTGANEDRPGYFEQADGGTLFLDEIGDLSPDLQVKLLRTLETKTVRRLGARSDLHVDIRLVSATNRFDSAGTVEGLREDVKFRLAGHSIHLPPLRERREEVLPLALELLAKAMQEYGKQGIAFGQTALEAMDSALFPGNVRELRQRIGSAVARSGNHSLIGASILGLDSDRGAVRLASGLPGAASLDEPDPAFASGMAGSSTPAVTPTLDDWLEVGNLVSLPAHVDTLLGRKAQLDETIAQLNRKLAVQALRATRNAVTSEYAITAAAQLLFNDPAMKGSVPARRIATMLGFNQDKKFSNAELDAIVASALGSN